MFSKTEVQWNKKILWVSFVLIANDTFLHYFLISYSSKINRYQFLCDVLNDAEASTSEKERDVVLLPPKSGNKD